MAIEIINGLYLGSKIDSHNYFRIKIFWCIAVQEEPEEVPLF